METRKSLRLELLHGRDLADTQLPEDSFLKTFISAILILAAFSAPAFANVVVSSPASGDTVGSPVQYAATAITTTCSKGVASMGVYVNNQLIALQNGTSLNAAVSLSPGAYNTVVEEWDYCGGATFTQVPITVTSSSGIFVTSPANNSTVSSLANYVATATTTSCSKGVACLLYTSDAADEEDSVDL